MENIKLLRRKQLIWSNICFFFLMILLFMIGYYLMSTFAFFILIGSLSILGALLNILSIKYNLFIFEWIRKLHEYEREKLGNTWIKNKKITSVFLCIVGVYQIWLAFNIAPIVISEINYLFVIKIYSMFVLFGLLIINASSYFHSRNDANAKVFIKGYFWKQLLVGLVTVFVSFLFIIWYIFSIIF